MNKNTEILYDENTVIKDAIGITDSLNTLRQQNPSAYKAAVRKLITFLVGYVDGYHYYKEENILFPEMIGKDELLKDGIIKKMLDNHKEFRGMIKLIENSLNEGEFEMVQNQLQTYTTKLLAHLVIENEKVFQATEILFNDAELENTGTRFQDIDKELGIEKKESLVEVMNEVRKGLN